eukprot:CAMPEP_0194141420 /NCGR_PEP_ID=MMETSP0152-20130528/10831_1 /TAXON_ID=1049557 /ORGANISM="Thalassiothrix antarctica, Strain L6-D1" /LENGTH=53 /DNA_ID=CAMNT_0038840035 /DNA_START=290 /DNA_END=451 /DNA_ORIENTATION=+
MENPVAMKETNVFIIVVYCLQMMEVRQYKKKFAHVELTETLGLEDLGRLLAKE